MHSHPTPPRPTQRSGGLLPRVLRSRARRRGGRLALGALGSTAVTALVLAVPVSGATDATGSTGATPFVARESVTPTGAPRPTTGDSPVVMGQDGPPTSSATSSQPDSAPAETSASATDAGAPSAEQPSTEAAAAETATAAVAGTAAAAGTTATESSTQPPAPAPVQAAAPVVAAPAQAAAAVPAGVGTEGQVLALVNAERASAGCGALVADPGLASVARAHSRDMRDRDFFSHVDPDGLDPFDRATRAGLDVRAENIARGEEDAADVMDTWMSSRGHRANILDCSLTRLGVGMVEGDDGPWWTQLFA